MKSANRNVLRQLHWSWIRKKIGMYLGADFLLFFSLIIMHLADTELSVCGGIVWSYSRSLTGFSNGIRNLFYVVKDERGTLLLSHNLYSVLVAVSLILGILLLVQFFSLLSGYQKEGRNIRRILAPLNDLALKAEELSRLAYTEDKYHMIEDAITDLQPEESEKAISLGDPELAGIETAINNLLRHMREIYRQQARFVNDASHELRTPIAVIQGYANMLSRWGREDEKVLEESISAIRHESDHMQHLVEQLLFLARGDSGKTRLKPETVSLNQLMQEIYEESLMIDEDHLYRYQAPTASITITADLALLKQAVRILVDNAAKYTKKGDEILLTAGTLPDNQVYLQVQDTGIGMAGADVEHMFERFYRADDARAFQGTGLGLSIAKWIVDKHQGHFDILSRTELGTRIRIVLPVSGQK